MGCLKYVLRIYNSELVRDTSTVSIWSDFLISKIFLSLLSIWGHGTFCHLGLKAIKTTCSSQCCFVFFFLNLYLCLWVLFVCVVCFVCACYILYLLVWVCAQNYLDSHWSRLMVSVSEHKVSLDHRCLTFPGLENDSLGSGGAAVRATFEGTARGRQKHRQRDALLFLRLFCQPQALRILKLPSVPYVIAHSQPDCRAKFALWPWESAVHTASPNLVNAYFVLTVQSDMGFSGEIFAHIPRSLERLVGTICGFQRYSIMILYLFYQEKNSCILCGIYPFKIMRL